MPFRSKDSFDFSSSFHRSTLVGALMTWKILTLLNYVIFIIIGKWVLLNEIYWLWNLSQLFVFSWFLMKSLSRLLIECQQLSVLYRARWEIAICKKHQDFRNSHRFLKFFFSSCVSATRHPQAGVIIAGTHRIYIEMRLSESSSVTEARMNNVIEKKNQTKREKTACPVGGIFIGESDKVAYLFSAVTASHERRETTDDSWR